MCLFHHYARTVLVIYGLHKYNECMHGQQKICLFFFFHCYFSFGYSTLMCIDEAAAALFASLSRCVLISLYKSTVMAPLSTWCYYLPIRPPSFPALATMWEGRNWFDLMCTYMCVHRRASVCLWVRVCVTGRQLLSEEISAMHYCYSLINKPNFKFPIIQ